MGINNYSLKPRSDGYRGIRVYRKIGGKDHCKYFAKDETKKATAHDKKLEKRQAAAKKRAKPPERQRYTNKRFKAPRRTPVVGLTITFSRENRCTPVRYYPLIVITHSDKARNIRFHTSRKITSDRGLSDTWRESCKILSEQRGFARVKKGWYEMCPSLEDFKKLRNHYNEKGKNIPISSLDILISK